MIRFSRASGGSPDLSDIERQIAELSKRLTEPVKTKSHVVAGLAGGTVGVTITELIHRVLF